MERAKMLLDVRELMEGRESKTDEPICLDTSVYCGMKLLQLCKKVPSNSEDL